MSVGGIINEEAFITSLRKTLNKEMLEAAEPVVKEMLAAAEREMRKRLGEMIVGLLATQYSAYRDGRDLIIRVQMEPKPGGIS